MNTEMPAVKRPRQAASYLGIAESTLWLRVANDPTFPRPRKLGPNQTVFITAELDAFIARAPVVPRPVRHAVA